MAISESISCQNCKAEISESEFLKACKVCPHCNHHHYMTADERLELLVDSGSFEPYDTDLYSIDFLKFPDYQAKLERDSAKTGLKSEMHAGVATIGGHTTSIAIGDAGFMGGTMGSVVGEKLARCIERATERRLPLIIVSAFGGGARMHEGTVALMQMAKTATACAMHAEAGRVYISVLTDPTMGGTAASFASLGDIIVAEPGARIGFAGYRARAKLREELPDDFQKSEFLLKHGFIDRIVQRREMKSLLVDLLDFCLPL